LGSSAGPSGLGRHPGRRDGGVTGGPPPHTGMGLRRPVPEPVRSLARLAAMPVLCGNRRRRRAPRRIARRSIQVVSRDCISTGYSARDAAGHRRPRHGERRTNYRAVIAQMGCRSSIARHPSFHLPDTQIQRRPFHRHGDHASNESGANGSAAASTNGTPLPVTTGRSALSTWRNSTFYPSAA